MSHHRATVTLVILASIGMLTERARADSTATLPPPEIRAWQTGAIAPDRLQHASLAFSAGLAAGIVTREPAAAAGFALAVGIGKELIDRRTRDAHGRPGRFDLGDLLADAVGAALAAGATAAIER